MEGRSVACLVAADVLARAGVPVRITSSGGLGRSFAPVRMNGERLEFGPRLLELSYDDDDRLDGPWCEPVEYVGGDHRPWMRWIRDYILGLVVPRRVQLRQWRNDFDTVDFLLTGDLRSLPSALSFREKRAVEASALVSMREYPDGITSEQLADEPSYRVVSMMLHGTAFHDLFIGPMLDAMLGPSGDIAAADHRKVWLPLFRPLEILQALWGESQRPRRSMWLGMSEAVEALVARVQPLIEADLPPGLTDVLVDSPPVKGGGWMDLHFRWHAAAAPGLAESVTWLYRGAERPYRATVSSGVVCSESGPCRTASWVHSSERVISVSVPLSTGRVDVGAGVIGAGSFNDQVMQGLACAAGRLS